MTIPRLKLAGIPVMLQAGAPVQNYVPIGGSSLIRLSKGDAVKMRHWRRTAITVSGTGALNPGLDGLDYDDPMILDCTMSRSVSSESTTIRMIGVSRPDVEPWGLALVDGAFRKTPCVVTAGVAELEPVPRATRYQLCWMPRFEVFAEPPQIARDSGTGVSSWSLQAEEV